MSLSIFERIAAFNTNRNQTIVKQKYKRMAQNPFRFFRGTCHLFYEDLANDKHLPVLPPSPRVWICGDLHLENFGSYKADNHLVYFDLNDFDEGCLAPAAHEIARFVTSIVVAFEGFDINKKDTVKACQAFLTSYADTLKKGKARYIEPQTAKGIVQEFLEKISQNTFDEQLKERTEVDAFDKKQLKTTEKRLLPIENKLKKKLLDQTTVWFKAHREERFHWTILDAGFRVSGTSSIGVERYLLLAQDPYNHDDMELLDMKQALPSVISSFMLDNVQPIWSNEAERVVAIQERMQNTTPALLTTLMFEGKPFVLKEMQPMSDKIDVKEVFKNLSDAHHVLRNMGLLTASAQLRSGGRQGSAITDELIAFGEDTSWQAAIVTFAFAYAKQVKKDFDSYVAQRDSLKRVLGLQLEESTTDLPSDDSLSKNL